MHLPQFSVSYESWPGFSDSFKSAIHDNPSFSDTQYLIYLRSCFSGKTLEKIESLGTTAVNHPVASSILEKYYDGPISVINNRVKAYSQLKHRTVILNRAHATSAKSKSTHASLLSPNKPTVLSFV